MKFNPNGSLLAINKRSTVHLKESIRLIDINEMELLDSSVQLMTVSEISPGVLTGRYWLHRDMTEMLNNTEYQVCH